MVGHEREYAFVRDLRFGVAAAFQVQDGLLIVPRRLNVIDALRLISRSRLCVPALFPIHVVVPVPSAEQKTPEQTLTPASCARLAPAAAGCTYSAGWGGASWCSSARRGANPDSQRQTT